MQAIAQRIRRKNTYHSSRMSCANCLLHSTYTHRYRVSEHTRIRTRTRIRTHAHAHARTPARPHARTHARLPARPHARTHARTPTHIILYDYIILYTHAQWHTRTRMHWSILDATNCAMQEKFTEWEHRKYNRKYGAKNPSGTRSDLLSSG